MQHPDFAAFRFPKISYSSPFATPSSLPGRGRHCWEGEDIAGGRENIVGGRENIVGWFLVDQLVRCGGACVCMVNVVGDESFGTLGVWGVVEEACEKNIEKNPPNGRGWGSNQMKSESQQGLWVVKRKNGWIGS